MKTRGISRRLLALLLAAMLVLTLLPVSAMAENEPTITVYVTVSNQGTIASGSDTAHTVMADVPVTVPSNGETKATVDAVMQAAHSIYCPDGYTTSNTAYGVSVTKLWGIQTTNTLFFINGTGLTKDVGTDKVADGDHVTASVNKDNTYYADWYSGFNTSAKTVAVGESFTLTLSGYLGMAYTEAGKTPAALSGISVGTVSSAGFTALDNKTTGADGTVALSFDAAGTYLVSASGTVSGEVTDYSAAPVEGLYPTKTVDCPIIAPACVVTVQAPSVTTSVTDASDGTIPSGGYTYNVGDTATALKVAPSAGIEGGTYTYQWCCKTVPDAASSSMAAGTRTQQTYTPPTTQDGLLYYYCKVTYKLNGYSYTAESNCVPVKVITSAAQTPTMNAQPSGGTYLAGASGVKAVSVSAKVTDGGKLTYQWYLSRNGGEFQILTDQTTGSVTPAESSPCVLQYYCRVTNTIESVGGATFTASVKTDTAKVEFKSAADYGAAWSGDGSKTSPYLIASATDLQTLSTLCSGGLTFQGKYFKMTADIMLPDGWTPVGTSTNRFCGNFNGGGHLLTVPENGLPLLGYVRYASVSNLNIYGTKIASSGLVAYYSEDSGITQTIDIANCTLKAGSSTLASGFIGGYASGINTVNVTNCTVEAGVVIGYDKTQSNIGSFGGGFNGYVTNCASYATVYGVNNVGGLVGIKGQSMGACTVQDSAFHGTVEATGNYAGGIVGKGYSNVTAPNSPCVSILNCFADGSVSGANYVGGIFGGEGGVIQCWPNGIGYVQNNCFAGTVSATAENAVVGGIIGNMRALDCYNIISNNYFTAACGADKGIGQVEFVITPETTGSIGSGWAAVYYNGAVYGRGDDPTGTGADALAKSCTAAALTNGTVVRALNAGLNSSGDWTQGTNGPVFGGKRHLLGITCSSLSGTSGVTARVGEADILSGKMLTLTYSDGTTEMVDAGPAGPAARNFTVSSSLIGKSMAASVMYNNHQLVFRLNVNAGSSAPDPDPTPSTDITVSFTLLGDDAHGAGGTTHTLKAGNLTAWISQTPVTVASGSKVMTVLAKVLNKNGYSWMNDDKANSNTGNYIQSITTPAGVTLAEFTNGASSGWMYTLNGTHPLLGINEQKVADGDVIVFHYTDNYHIEEGSGTWNDTNAGNPAATSASVIKQAATVSGKTATVAIREESIASAIEAVKNSRGSITISPTDTGSATDIRVSIPKAAAKTAADGSVSLAIETGSGNVIIPHNTLSQLVSAASGSDLQISVQKKTASDVTDKSIDATNAIVTEVTITSGNTAITTFGGKSLTIHIPVDSTYSEGASYNVIIISADGTTETAIGKCVRNDGSLFAEVDTTHLSTFLVTHTKSTNFTDVKSGVWFYDAVKYAVQKELFNGTSATTFAPNDNMTRAMLVTALYRLEGKPAVTGANSFTDVQSGQWYTDAVTWASANKIVSGYGGGLFGTNDNITREQMTAILYRYAQYKSYGVTKTADLRDYTDASNIGAWATDAMKWANAAGLITGTTATKLSPTGNATRAQAATILMRFSENTVK